MRDWDILVIIANTTASNLKQQIESKHEGVRYPCDRCWEYAGTTTSSLKQHIKCKHERWRYPCDKCEYVATLASYLKQQGE